MAITVKKKFGSEWYIPIDELDTDESERARFKLRELNREQVDDALEGSTNDNNGNLHLTSRGVRAALKHGILEWENVNDEDGAPMKCSFVNHRFLPWSLGVELASEIISKSLMTEDEQKNS